MYSEILFTAVSPVAITNFQNHMKKSTLILVSTLFISLTMFFGCQSSAEKVEDAKDKVTEAEKDLEDSKSDLVQDQAGYY